MHCKYVLAAKTAATLVRYLNMTTNITPATTPDAETTTTTTTEITDTGAGSEELTAEKWLEGLDEKSKGFLDSHTSGLKSALEKEREMRKQYQDQFKDLLPKAEKGSELEKQLQAAIEKQAETDKRSEFYDQAHARGVTNLKLAWLAATSDESLQLRDGSVDFTKLQATHPELFKAKTASTSAGSGAGTEPTPNQTVSDSIRAALNRRRGG